MNGGTALAVNERPKLTPDPQSVAFRSVGPRPCDRVDEQLRQ